MDRRAARSMLGTRSSRRKGTKYQTHNEVRVKGANRGRKPLPPVRVRLAALLAREANR
jgi:hypothetical protein